MVLAGGGIELSARPDLSIGAPAVDEASVAMVEIKSGGRRPEHRTDLHFYALLEALRSPAPPFVVATYYTRTGELDVDPVTEELLVDAARRTAVGTRLLWDLAHRVGRRTHSQPPVPDAAWPGPTAVRDGRRSAVTGHHGARGRTVSPGRRTDPGRSSPRRRPTSVTSERAMVRDRLIAGIAPAADRLAVGTQVEITLALLRRARWHPDAWPIPRSPSPGSPPSSVDRWAWPW